MATDGVFFFFFTNVSVLLLDESNVAMVALGNRWLAIKCKCALCMANAHTVSYQL